jgi:hypothetical protein
LVAATQVGTILEDQGWPQGSSVTARRVLESVRSAADRSELAAGELNMAAWLLLSAKPESLRDAELARQLASNACDLERAAGGAELWKYLDTLALAQHATGSPQSAVASQEEALRLLPPEGASEREGIEKRLGRYREAALRQPA